GQELRLYEFSQMLLADGYSGAIVVWVDQRSGRQALYAHHVLASGQLDLAWPVDGRLLSAGAPTGEAVDGVWGWVGGSGGALVAWDQDDDPPNSAARTSTSTFSARTRPERCRSAGRSTAGSSAMRRRIRPSRASSAKAEGVQSSSGTTTATEDRTPIASASTRRPTSAIPIPTSSVRCSTGRSTRAASW